ncbi:hypothetical protein 16Q_105 [Pseudomonas phage 16Q]|nr:hypothetical protein 16Q_105 [Pseudomonas phage 16Q]
MNPSAMISPSQWEMLKQHLALVFNKVTPRLSTPQPLPKGPMITGIPPKVGPLINPAPDPWTQWPYQITC